MTDHDEALFQRVNQARAKYVAALRITLNAAGLREKSTAPQVLYNQMQNPVDLQKYLGASATADGYDIERVIQAATAIRGALAPFDASLPQATKEQT